MPPAEIILSNLQYRGYRSITLQLVLLAFVTGTVLVVLHYISADNWVNGVLGMLAAYVARDGMSKAAEAYMMTVMAKNQPVSPGSLPS
jgi:hypothetical protein